MSRIVNNNWRIVSEGPWSKRRKHQAVVFGEKLLLIGGFDGESALDLNDIWSWDGQSWQLVSDHANWSGRDGHCALILHDSLFVLGGTDDPYFCKNDVWRSDDGGKHWNRLLETSPWPERWQHASCVHNGSMYISGGWGGQFLNDIWRSDDGITWVQVCDSCPWRPRMFHSLISFKNALYILGGHDGHAQLNDVWASSDEGQTWIEVCNVAAWEERQGHATVVLDGYVYVMGGFGGSTRFNDLWKSDDCAHWTQVMQHCEWSPRQGHACTVYKGSIYLLGGFDESGYSNNMYVYDIQNRQTHGNNSYVTDSMNTWPDDSASSKIITVSMACALDMIVKLTNKRAQRSVILTEIQRVIDYVSTAIKFRGGQNQGSRIHSLSESSDHQNQQVSYVTPELFTSPETSIPKVENNGNPVNQNIGLVLSDSELQLECISPSMLSIQDDNLKLDMALSIDQDDDFQGTDLSWHHTTEFDEGDLFNSSSSARLREDMNLQRSNLVKIQRTIRNHAENGEIDQMQNLISDRTALAKESLRNARRLLRHTSTLRQVQTERQAYISKVFRKLESLQTAKESSIRTSEEPIIHCSWAEWMSITQQFKDMIEKFQSYSSSTATILEEFTSTMRTHASLSNQICDWVERNGLFYGSLSKRPSQSLLQPQTITSIQWNDTTSSNVHSNSLLNIEQTYESLVNDYQHTCETVDRKKMALKSTIDKELMDITNNYDTLKNFRDHIIEKSIAFLSGLLTQNRIDIIEITSMMNEVQEWYDKLQKLSNTSELNQICQSLIAQNIQFEENLIKLEDERIDTKSALEKASFRYPSLNRLSSKLPSSSMQTNIDKEINQLKISLANAEQKVRDTRKNMRKWYRETRQYAADYAPELFYSIQDLRSPGSILGDGGFAEKTKLPRRRLEEYENIRKLSSPDDQIVQDSVAPPIYGRHLLFRATYDNEDVVLKGFVMHEGDQRRGLEREISILSRLKNDCIICPQAIVEGSATPFDSTVQVTIFIEYPYYKGGNLSTWLKSASRKPWELQSIARQILYGLSFLHDHGVIHKDIKPSNVLLHEDGRVVLTDFELSKEVSIEDGEEFTTTSTKVGTKGFMAPEIEAGQPAVFASDMYSFGVLLYFMHFPSKFSTIVPGRIQIPSNNDTELTDLLEKLLDINPNNRLTAIAALMHPYFRITFVEKLLRDGEVVEQDRKLEAVRSMLDRCRSENRNNIERITIRRNKIVEDVLKYFRELSLDRIKANLKVTFSGEPGIDEGGLLSELFSIFYESIFEGEGGLFEGSSNQYKQSPSAKSMDLDDDHVIDNENLFKSNHTVVLPTIQGADSPEILHNLRSFGRAMVKTLYEGRRIGSRLCPSVFKFITNTAPNMRDLQVYDPETARSLQWILATIGVEEFGLHFESVGAPEIGPVDDMNKSRFVMMKINNILVDSRRHQLLAIKAGFVEAMTALSEEASPFLSLLSHADWRVILCGETSITGPQIVSCLKFQGFPKKSQIAEWLKEILLCCSEDHLRQFLVFITGSPSLPSAVGSKVEITVRYQSRSGALPIAHTCFYQLDIPDYRSKDILQSKLMYAIQNVNTFEIV